MKRILGLLTILVIALFLAGCTTPTNLSSQPTPTPTQVVPRFSRGDIISPYKDGNTALLVLWYQKPVLEMDLGDDYEITVIQRSNSSSEWYLPGYRPYFTKRIGLEQNATYIWGNVEPESLEGYIWPQP